MKLKHPDSKATIEVNDSEADPYLSQGWAEQGSKKPAESEPNK